MDEMAIKCAVSGAAATAAMPRRSGARVEMTAFTVAEVGGNPRPATSSATALSRCCTSVGSCCSAKALSVRSCGSFLKELPYRLYVIEHLHVEIGPGELRIIENFERDYILLLRARK